VNLQEPDNPSRREWILRLGELVALAGISGMLPETVATLVAQDAAQLPPGLYDPSQDHLVHALASAGKKWAPPPGSETDYIDPNAPYDSKFFTTEEFKVITRFIEVLLGNVAPQASSQAANWLDRWLHASAGVRNAAQHIDPLHRALAVAYYGESEVHELETAAPQSTARAGLAALDSLCQEKHCRGFLQLTPAEQSGLISALSKTDAGHPLRQFFELARTQAIRGYYTSRQGLDELDYKGNAFYPESPGCEPNS